MNTSCHYADYITGKFITLEMSLLGGEISKLIRSRWPTSFGKKAMRGCRKRTQLVERTKRKSPRMLMLRKDRMLLPFCLRPPWGLSRHPKINPLSEFSWDRQ